MSAYLSSLRARVGHDLLLICAAGSYVFDADGRVLLIRHAEGGRWTNPGGMVEPFETPADAAVRETWEETGLLVELTRFIGVFGGRDHHITYANGDEVTYLAFAFAAKAVGGTLALDRTEALEARYVTRAEALELDLSPPIRRALTVAFEAGPGTYFDTPTWATPGAETLGGLSR
jgi:8-oxo-dGTP pyrophosphatase MutT (NUDIX family)